MRISLLYAIALLALCCHANQMQYNEEMALRYAWISAASYCDTTSLAVWECRACKEVSGFTFALPAIDPIGQGFAFIGLDTRYEQIVISFRGTNPDIPANIIVDLAGAELVDFPLVPGAKVGLGFWTIHKILSLQLEKELDILHKIYPWYNVTITGHSLGGALATLAAACMTNYFDAERVTLITFGSPRVGNIRFAEYVNTQTNAHWRVTHGFDPVPHVPGTIMGFYHSGTEVWYPISSPPEYKPVPPGMYRRCANNTEDPSCSNSVQYLSIVVYDHFEYLGIPISEYCCLNSSSCNGRGWGLCCEQPNVVGLHCSSTYPYYSKNTGLCPEYESDICLRCPNYRPGFCCQPGWWGYYNSRLVCAQQCSEQQHCSYPECRAIDGSCQDSLDDLDLKPKLSCLTSNKLIDSCCAAGWWGVKNNLLTCDLPCNPANHCGEAWCTVTHGTCWDKWNCATSNNQQCCKTGWWGTKDGSLSCDLPCDTTKHHCKIQGCRVSDGMCVGFSNCVTGPIYLNLDCCIDGWWGVANGTLSCNKQCDSRCWQKKCRSYDGQCDF